MKYLQEFTKKSLIEALYKTLEKLLKEFKGSFKRNKKRFPEDIEKYLKTLFGKSRAKFLN